VVFVARFGVQGHLYEVGKTGWLGVTRIAMGWPLTALAALVTYGAIKAVLRALPDGERPVAAEIDGEPVRD
jgi:hypothetical protein